MVTQRLGESIKGWREPKSFAVRLWYMTKLVGVKLIIVNRIRREQLYNVYTRIISRPFTYLSSEEKLYIYSHFVYPCSYNIKRNSCRWVIIYILGFLSMHYNVEPLPPYFEYPICFLMACVIWEMVHRYSYWRAFQSQRFKWNNIFWYENCSFNLLFLHYALHLIL